MQLDDFGVRREATRLSNGARLVVFERPGMPVSMRAAFWSGGRYDPPGKEGLAHFAEHMVVAGTQKFPSKDKLANYIEQYGGVFGATTNSELMNINISLGDPADLAKAVELLNEMLTRSLLDEKTFEMERGSILREFSKKQSNPAAWLWEVWRELYFQDTQVGRSVLGSEKTIRDLKLYDIRSYFKNYINSARLVVVVSGGVKLDQVKSMLENGLDLKATNEVARGSELPITRVRQVAVKKYTINDQIDLAFGFRTCPISAEDNIALDVLATILGGGRASTLNRILRYEMGLVYSISSHNMEQSDHGSWVTTTQCAKKDLTVVLEEVTKELNRASSGGLTPDELEFARNKLIKSKRMQLQTSESWVGFHTGYEAFIPDRNWTVVDYMRQLSQVTLTDLERVAKKYFKPDRWYLALCGDIKEGEVKLNY
jgi:predicted Zn-dependent peptidase